MGRQTRLTGKQDARSKRVKASTFLPVTPSTPSRGLKRYVGYDGDDEDEDSQMATKKMRELSVQDVIENGEVNRMETMEGR